MIIKGKVYKGQALAIVLVVLMIGSIMVLGLMARNIKSQQKVFDEKLSSESIELSNTLINYSKSITKEQVDAACGGTNVGCCLTGADIADFSGNTSIGTNFSCQSTNSSDSGVRLCFEPVGSFEDYQLNKDATFALVFVKGSYPNCDMVMNFEQIGSGHSAIYINFIYAQKDASGNVISFKQFDGSDDIELAFNNDALNWQGWEIPVGNNVTLNTAPKVVGGTTYQLDEIRVTAIGSSFNIDLNDSSNCMGDITMYKVTADANCGGDYRGNWYYKPIRETALSVFDYTIYNKNGNLENGD